MIKNFERLGFDFGDLAVDAQLAARLIELTRREAPDSPGDPPVPVVYPIDRHGLALL
jgi:hypothetical protein